MMIDINSTFSSVVFIVSDNSPFIIYNNVFLLIGCTVTYTQCKISHYIYRPAGDVQLTVTLLVR